jgi:hypothetical protein
VEGPQKCYMQQFKPRMLSSVIPSIAPPNQPWVTQTAKPRLFVSYFYWRPATFAGVVTIDPPLENSK